MPEHQWVEWLLASAMSIIMFTLTGLALSFRPRQYLQAARWLLYACAFGLQALQIRHPLPTGKHNAYGWAYGALALALIVQFILERRKAKSRRFPSAASDHPH